MTSPVGTACCAAARARAQRGVGLAGILIVLALAAFFVTLLVRMGPSYMTYFQVRSLMDRVIEKPELRGAGTRQVLAAVSRQLYIDGVRTVDKSDFQIKREGNEVFLVLDYQAQEHLGFNVDVLMHFEHRVPFPPRP
ncbi:DUF4845 domain-containing protein [Halochromatium glycolicum]|uniref:DUF4845 domain-containing protein n=1 Tax=Halochromatium glycolicum TaxID=85075 RepID=UPI00190C0DFE|nr:DUF4845 domain-containing protein [Halochromatium glycolicum]